MQDQTFQGLPCPIFIREYLINGHKYKGMEPQVTVHLRTCQVCRQAYARLSEQLREDEDGDLPGFRG